LGLDFYRSRLGGTEWHYLMAAAVLTTAPLVVLFFFLQRSFLRGLSFMKDID
jgi:multiple sugar transport system permease protein